MLASTFLISEATRPVAVRLCLGRLNPGPTGPWRSAMGTPTEGLRSRLSGMVDEEQKEKETEEGEEKRRGEQDLVTPGGALGSSRGKGSVQDATSHPSEHRPIRPFYLALGDSPRDSFDVMNYRKLRWRVWILICARASTPLCPCTPTRFAASKAWTFFHTLWGLAMMTAWNSQLIFID
jgi:hypothetical protein